MMAGSIAPCNRCPSRTPRRFAPWPWAQICRLTLRGSAPAIALPDVKQFRVFSQSPTVEGGFEALYAQTVDQALRGTGTETFEAIDMLRKADPSRFQPENGAHYPNGRVGQTMQQVAQLLQSRHRSRSNLRRHRRLGQPRKRRRRAGPALESPARPGPIDGCLLARHGRPHGRHRRGDHVRIRPHRARKRQPRHRSRPRQLHAGDGRRRSRAAKSTASGRAWRPSS